MGTRAPEFYSTKWLSVLLLTILFLAGCGGGGSGSDSGGSSDVGPSTTNQSSLASAQAVSSHYVVVTFTGPAGSDAEDTSNYVITGPDAVRLPIIDAELSADGQSVTLTTATQQVVQYELSQPGSQQASVSQGFFIRTAAAAAGDSVTFTGSSQPEPVLMTAISLSNTSLLLTFSERMSVDTETIEYYRIVAADDSAPSQDVGGLEITDAVLGADKTTVILTTSSQDNIEYSIKVTNVTADPASTRINPTRNTGTFFGIAPVDNDPPTVDGAVSTGLTTMIVTFSEPVDENAGDPANYVISYCKVDIDPCPASDIAQLTVVDAELTQHNTQVILTTLPQTVGTDYSVEVVNITDIAGNEIDVNADSDGDGVADNTVNVISVEQTDIADVSTLPRVVGAISTSNTGVTVAFSKPMGEGAEDPENYAISQEKVNSEAGVLHVTGAFFPNPNDRTVIVLTTLSQNEVTYRVTAVNVKDVFGNSLAAREFSADSKLFLDPTSATFAGTPGESVILTITDLNNDGIIDGWDDNDNDSVLSVGDRIVGSDGNNVVIVDLNGNGVLDAVDGWNDLNGNLIPDAGDEITAFSVDTDGDGLTDAEEQRGWQVRVTLADDTVLTRQVTSNPFVGDTDNDGVSDSEERHFLSDPRDSDTDDDQLTDYRELNAIYSDPFNQDSDGDGLADGLENDFFNTSPILDDTDGDGFSDDFELLGLNRDPRVSDLPRPRIDIGDVALRLDTRFTYTDTQGVSRTSEESVEATLTESDTRTFSFSDESTTERVIGNSTTVGVENEIGGSAGVLGYLIGDTGVTLNAENTLSFSFTDSETTTVSRESSETAEQSYQESLTTSQTVDETREVTREVVGASIQVPLTIANVSDIPFSLSNLEVTALMQDPLDRSRFLPVATLVPELTLTTGEVPEINIGPFLPERGPFIFSSREVFPELVEDLLRNPRGLIFRVANFDLTDEFGRNFAFVSQEVNDRTAGITVDFGSRAERFRVATTSSFDGEGDPQGISMGFALQDILGFDKNAPNNAITVGVNGCGETLAVGDDIQVIREPEGLDALCPPVATDGTIVEAGPNGIVDSTPLGDDLIVANEIIDGGDGCAHTRKLGDDVEIVEGACVRGGPDGEVVLPGANGVIETLAAGDDEQSTISGYGTKIVGNCDGASVTPGAACTIDADCRDASSTTGVCQATEVLTRVRGVKAVPEESRFWAVIASADIDVSSDFDDIPLQAGDRVSLAFVQDKDDDGLFARQEFIHGSSDKDVDSDDDNLGDFEEVVIGWDISVGGSTYTAYSDPSREDSDSDRLSDDLEQAAGTDPRKRDTDGDGVTDFQELNGYSILDKNGQTVINVILPYKGAAPGGSLQVIVDGGNGIAESQISGPDDQQVIASGESVTALGLVILPGINGTIETVPAGDDSLFSAAVASAVDHDNRFATDPLDDDTDGDGLTDGVERNLGADPNDATDADDFRDTDRDGLVDGLERAGWTIAGGSTEVTSDPFEPDTDFDGLPDLLESTIKSNPRKRDTDNDGLLDFDEFYSDSTDSIDFTAFRDFEDICFDADRCVYNPEGSLLYGTSLTKADTDLDGRTDREEVFDGWTVTVFGELPFDVKSSPIDADADRDGSNDFGELANGTDPGNADTDGDGVLDGDDGNPRGFGKGVTVSFVSWTVGADDCEVDIESYGDFDYLLEVKKDGDVVADGSVSGTNVKLGDDYSLYVPKPRADKPRLDFAQSTQPFNLSPGQFFEISGRIDEKEDTGESDVGATWSLPTQTLFFGDLVEGAIKEVKFSSGPGCYSDDEIILRVIVGP